MRWCGNQSEIEWDEAAEEAAAAARLKADNGSTGAVTH